MGRSTAHYPDNCFTPWMQIHNQQLGFPGNPNHRFGFRKG
jgi:hypothetical protein